MGSRGKGGADGSPGTKAVVGQRLETGSPASVRALDVGEWQSGSDNVHSVTKFLMAFAAVLSIFLSAMVIAYAANTDRILQDYGNEQAARRAAEASYAAGAGQWSTERGNLMADLNNQKMTSQQKDSRLAELELERATLRNEHAEAQRARDSFKARVDEFAEIIKTNQTIIDRYSQEVSQLRDNEIASRSRALETEERMANLLSTVDVLQANNRVLTEQMVELRNTLASGAGAGANAGAVKYDARLQILGRVENVRLDGSTSKTIVQLNVGSNTGVANGMIFRVVRGGEFIANVVITKTDLAFSIAEVEILQKDIQVGDEVRTKL
jgi:hypothetical protein